MFKFMHLFYLWWSKLHVNCYIFVMPLLAVARTPSPLALALTSKTIDSDPTSTWWQFYVPKMYFVRWCRNEMFAMCSTWQAGLWLPSSFQLLWWQNEIQIKKEVIQSKGRRVSECLGFNVVVSYSTILRDIRFHLVTFWNDTTLDKSSKKSHWFFLMYAFCHLSDQ